MSYKTARGLTSCGFIVKNPTELSNFVYREYELRRQDVAILLMQNKWHIKQLNFKESRREKTM